MVSSPLRTRTLGALRQPSRPGDFAIQALKDHVANQIAGLEAQAVALEAANAHPGAIRQRRMRRRRKLGMHSVKTEISTEAVELLAKRGYLNARTPASMGLAITALLSDLVLDAT